MNSSTRSLKIYAKPEIKIKPQTFLGAGTSADSQGFRPGSLGRGRSGPASGGSLRRPDRINANEFVCGKISGEIYRSRRGRAEFGDGGEGDGGEGENSLRFFLSDVFTG